MHEYLTALCLVNVVLFGSAAAEFYPWPAAFVLVRLSGATGSRTTSAVVIGAVYRAGIAASLLRFSREEP